jgi:nicotinate-nucleotide adenylyltransferase
VPRRLGILGGTFNPPHLAHLALARCALSQLQLECVALMPSHTPPHKHALDDPGPAQRLRMCRLAVAGEERLCACDLEVKRPGPSYTVDTLQALHALRPDIQPTLILGSDVARTLPTWRSPERLLSLARLAVAERAGENRAEVLAAVRSLGAAAEQVRFLDMPPLDISSSMVRQRAAEGGDLVEWLGPVMASYISRHKLYRAIAGTAGPSPEALAQ